MLSRENVFDTVKRPVAAGREARAIVVQAKDDATIARTHIRTNTGGICLAGKHDGLGQLPFGNVGSAGRREPFELIDQALGNTTSTGENIVAKPGDIATATAQSSLSKSQAVGI